MGAVPSSCGHIHNSEAQSVKCYQRVLNRWGGAPNAPVWFTVPAQRADDGRVYFHPERYAEVVDAIAAHVVAPNAAMA